MPDTTYDTAPEPVRQTVMLLHLSALAGLVSGIGFLLGPAIVWQLKKGEHPSIDEAGREAVNFQLTMLVAGIVAGILCATIIGLVVGVPMAIACGVLATVCPVVAGIRAANGERFRYPFTYAFLK